MSKSRILFGETLALITSVFVSSAATPGSSYVSPRLANGEVEIRNACVMPAEAKLTKVGMKGKEGMAKQSDDWSTTLQTVVESHLKVAGVQVQAGGMLSDDLEKNPELQQVVIRLQEKYDSILAQIDKHPKDTRKARFSVGDEVALLPCAEKADTLVYVNGRGQVLTGGKKAFGLLVRGPAASTASLEVSLVDAKSGDVLAFMRLINAEKFVNDSDKAYGGRLDKLFKQMKIGKSSGR